MERVTKTARFLHQDHPVFAPDQFPGQGNNGAATTFAAMDRPPTGYPCHHHRAVKLDIERQVNHTRFGPKSFKDCRKMGNDIIFEFVVNHTSRMASSGAVLEAYMTLTADRRDNLLSMTSTLKPRAELALVSGRSALSR